MKLKIENNLVCLNGKPYTGIAYMYSNHTGQGPLCTDEDTCASEWGAGNIEYFNTHKYEILDGLDVT